MELFNSWQWQKGEIPDEICDYIINNIDDNLYKKGEVSNTKLKSARIVNIQTTYINWINALLGGYIRYAKSENFHYNLSDNENYI